MTPLEAAQAASTALRTLAAGTINPGSVTAVQADEIVAELGDVARHLDQVAAQLVQVLEVAAHGEALRLDSIGSERWADPAEAVAHAARDLRGACVAAEALGARFVGAREATATLALR